MNFMRHLVIGLCGILFTTLLSLCLLMIATKVVTAEPGTIKGWLSKSETYSGVVPFSMSLNAASLEASGLPQELVTSSLETALPASFLQKNTEQVVDSTYGWLNGSQATLHFSVPFPSRKDLFEKTLRDKLLASYSTDKLCLDGSMTVIDISLCGLEEPVLSIVVHDIADQVATQLGIFEESFTETTLSPSVKQDTKLVPSSWQKQSLYIVLSVVAMILLIVAIAQLSNDRIKSFNRLARLTFFSTAIATLLLIIGLSASETLISAKGLATNDIPEFLLKLIGFGLHDMTTILLYMYGPISIIALALWIELHRRVRARKAPKALQTGS